jgi:hypothetical protein
MQKNSVLSATSGKKNSGLKYFTFHFAAYTATKLHACVFPNSSPFLTALQAMAMKNELRDVRLR